MVKSRLNSLIEAVYCWTVAKRESTMLVASASWRFSTMADSGMAVGAAMPLEKRAGRAKMEKNEAFMFASAWKGECSAWKKLEEAVEIDGL